MPRLIKPNTLSRRYQVWGSSLPCKNVKNRLQNIIFHSINTQADVLFALKAHLVNVREDNKPSSLACVYTGQTEILYFTAEAALSLIAMGKL